MKKIREMLRLKFDLHASHRDIASACNISPSTVGEALARCRLRGVTWPLPDGLTDDELERQVYRMEPCKDPERPIPDWEWVHREQRRRDAHVSLFLLWEEYRGAHAAGYEYSWFCHQYAEWESRIEPVMKQVHKAGYATFVDYCGDKIAVDDRVTGEVRMAEIFVGALGASNYTFCEASWSQDSASWLASHTRMFKFFEGVTEIVVPDCLKSGVTKACFYEPELNPAYREFAKHYQIAVIPARKRHPKDKATVENAVLVVERFILAKLRNRRFYSLDELNEAIYLLLLELNQRPFQKLPGCREQAYLELDKPKLRSLPNAPFEMGEWKRATVNIDYHIQVDFHYYSVPYALVRRSVEIRVTNTVVEVLFGGQRVVCHKRSFIRGGMTTLAEHMPPNHREVARWSPEVVRRRAARNGPFTEALVLGIMERREHPEQGVRAGLGILSLCVKCGPERVESACQKAVEFKAFSYGSVKNILARGLDKGPSPLPPKPSVVHANIRGAEHYREVAAAC